MSKILVVYCHPYEKSFNHAVLETLMKTLMAQGHQINLIDLHADGFEPYYDKEELRLFHTGGTHDPLVERYLGWLKEADSLVVVTPIWWNSIPGMLKGFIDKVMKEGEGLSHTVTPTGIKGCLTNIRRAYVFTTSTSPTLYFRLLMGDGIKRIFINKTLRQLGVGKGYWSNFGGITGSKPERRQRYLERISTMTFA
ncbi:MAG: NAD(P)H-dependent oxidoreductase [Bifidobacterium psychraerophilum]